jgi:hypothetical protein
MTPHTQQTQLNGESIHDAEQDLQGDDGIDHALEQFLGEDCVFLNKFREVV